MEKAMAYLSQLQTTADRDILDAAAHINQALAHLSQLALSWKTRQALSHEALDNGDDALCALRG